MRVMSGVVAVTVALAFGLGVATAAQPHEVAPRQVPPYDLETEAIFEGTVTQVKEHVMLTCPGCGRNYVASMGHRGPGISLYLSTAVGILEVHVGPLGFLQTFDVEIEAGDQVEIVGSRVNIKGRTVALAKEVSVDGRSLLLRLNNGTPRWVRKRE
ncbi:MAG: hypothetical protein CL477_16485 [Acidobacteria bacterium]|nr:hypothetical protein [Acidobacteriota bacterium]